MANQEAVRKDRAIGPNPFFALCRGLQRRKAGGSSNRTRSAASWPLEEGAGACSRSTGAHQSALGRMMSL